MTSTSIDAGAIAGASGVDLRRRIIGRASGAGPVYDGRAGELLGLWLKTLLLSILTLGFYRFWGRTRIRKYLWSRVSLDGDRFEYDGTGGELFRRFLVAVAVIAPMLLLPVILILAGVAEWIVDALQSAFYFGLSYLALIGYYAGRRYRMTRTVWRGVRGGLDGSSTKYAALSLKVWALNFLTLGLYYPWARVRLWSYEANNMRFGDRRFTFEGSGRDLFGAWVLSYGAAIGALVLLVVLAVASGVIGRSIVGVGEASTVVTAVLAIFLAILVLPTVLTVIFLRFQASWLSYSTTGTRFPPVSLSAEVGTWRLLRLMLGNVAVLLLTLGLGWPFVGHRMLRFWSEQITLDGVEGLRELEQTAPPPRAGAEGLSQLLDAGGFA
jgi:uncharacterized membrane protein YjgN (DUF898 family)